MQEILIKALGQTIKHGGEVILVSKDLPMDCMVLFVSMNVWKEIKDKVIVSNKEV